MSFGDQKVNSSENPEIVKSNYKQLHKALKEASVIQFTEAIEKILKIKSGTWNGYRSSGAVSEYTVAAIVRRLGVKREVATGGRLITSEDIEKFKYQVAEVTNSIKEGRGQ
jgi:hypothetical protein